MEIYPNKSRTSLARRSIFLLTFASFPIAGETRFASAEIRSARIGAVSIEIADG